MSSIEVSVVDPHPQPTAGAEFDRPRPLVGEVFHRPSPGVHSEAGVLRAALVDASLLTPSRSDAAGVAIATVLRQRGISVLGQRDLLIDLLAMSEARPVLVDRSVEAANLPPSLEQRVRRILLRLQPADAARALTEGLPVRDWDADRPASPRDRFLLPPLPPAQSFHATAVSVGRRVLPALPPGAMPDARRAVALSATVQRMHPALLALRPTRYAPDRGLRRSAAQLDGDDVLLAADGSVVVGIGHRTSAHGARQLARTVLERCGVARVIVVRLPLDPRLDRLDRIIGLVDVGTALVHSSVYDDDRVSWSLDGIDPDTGELISGPPRAFRTVLDAVLGPEAAPPVVLPDLPRAAGPADYLPLEPGAVLTDAPPDDPTSALLERAGVEVVPVPDTAGPVGGLRRLVRPVSRDALRAA